MSEKPYEVSSGTWEAIQTEVNKLLPAIERGDDLAPDDVKEVKKISHTCRKCIKSIQQGAEAIIQFV